jgi:hypothetical protein
LFQVGVTPPQHPWVRRNRVRQPCYLTLLQATDRTVYNTARAKNFRLVVANPLRNTPAGKQAEIFHMTFSLARTPFSGSRSVYLLTQIVSQSFFSRIYSNFETTQVFPKSQRIYISKMAELSSTARTRESSLNCAFWKCQRRRRATPAADAAPSAVRLRQTLLTADGAASAAGVALRRR